MDRGVQVRDRGRKTEKKKGERRTYLHDQFLDFGVVIEGKIH